MEKSVFQEIVEGKISAYKLYEDNQFLVILDAFPKNLGHTLIFPKHQQENILLEDDQTVMQISLLAKRFSKLIQQKLNTKHIKWVSNIGAQANQKVFHTHFHLIPYYETEPKLDKNDLESVHNLLLER